MSEPERPLAGRLALVTGASRGIGASCAAHLARLGARVVLAARDATALNRVVLAVNELGSQALPVVCDLSKPEEIERLFVAARELGPLDVLVNNAALLRAGPFAEQSAEDFDAMLDVNLNGVVRCTRAALPGMLERGRGVVINVASVSGVSNVPKIAGLVGYAATKGAVIAFSEALAAEVAPQGVRVVALSPGAVATDMLRSVAPEHEEAAMRPGQVGKVVAWLATDDAAAVHQTNVMVWGGVQSSAAKG